LAAVGDVILIDNWSLRRWLLWPWCRSRGHQAVFYLPIAWNGVINAELLRCSCGRVITRRRVRPSITVDQYRERQL